MITSLLLISGMSCVLSGIIIIGINYIRGICELSKSVVIVFLFACISLILALLSSVLEYIF